MANLRKKKNLWLLYLLLPFSAVAQQTIADYSLLDNQGIITSSESNNPTLKYLTDKNGETDFVITGFSGNPTVLYQTSVPVIVTGYALVSSGIASADPKSFRLEGSNDGTSWVTLSSIFGAAFPSRNSTITTTVNRNESYTYIRLTIRGVNGGTDLRISEFQVFGYPSPMLEDITKKGEGVLNGQYPGESSSPLSNLLTNDLSQKYKIAGTKSFWIDYELPAPKKLTGYSLTSTTDANIKDNVRAWQLLGSNDHTNWDVLDVRSNKTPFSVTNNMQIYKIGLEDKRFNWASFADSAQSSMINLFWKSYGSGYYLTHSYHTNPDSINGGYNYWWMAHVLDVFVDAYARTGDDGYKTKMNQIYNAQLSYGGGSLKNGFYDDMEWMGLACLRAYEVYNVPRWKEAAIQLWDWIKLGWNDNHGGGIQWVDVQPASKNACSNAPAIILAARLYNLTGDTLYLDWAKKIFTWMNDSLIFEDTGLVKDGYGNNQLSWTLTYNQGTWIGACLELYKITNEQKYYDIAMRTADYVVDDKTKFSPYGILYNNEGGGDGGLFKGIFLRYLSQWILSGKLDERRQNHFMSYFLENGKSVWESAVLRPKMIFKNTWNSRPSDIAETASKSSGYDASIHISAVMLFELLDELERKGILPANNQNPESLANADKEYKYFRLAVNANNDGSNVELAKWQLFDRPLNSIETHANLNPISVKTDGKKVTISSNDEENKKYSIYNVQGQLVKSGEFAGGQVSVHIQSGIYIVKVKNRVASHSQKVLIY
ncbi:MAG: glycoside hydrolase family 76 protein [Dysgonomonas sp.]